MVRRHVLESAQRQLSSGERLRKVVHPKHPYAIYNLVFDPGRDHQPAVPSGVEPWKWLGPVLLDALRQGDKTVAPEICQLVSEGRPAGDNDRYRVTFPELQRFFGQDTAEVARLLNGMDCLEGDVTAGDGPPAGELRGE